MFWNTSSNTNGHPAPAHYLNNAGNHLANAASYAAHATIHGVKAACIGSVAAAGWWLCSSALTMSAAPLATMSISSTCSTEALAVASIASNSTVAQSALLLSAGSGLISSVLEPLIEETASTVSDSASAISELFEAGCEVYNALAAGAEYALSSLIGDAACSADVA